jgi:hypothetical protein
MLPALVLVYKSFHRSVFWTTPLGAKSDTVEEIKA